MRSHMDLEDFLAITYTPIKAVEILTNIIYEKSNNDWGLYSCGNNHPIDHSSNPSQEISTDENDKKDGGRVEGCLAQFAA